MRQVLRVGVILALLGASVTLPIAAAQACTCADSAPMQQFNKADAVFLGDVTGHDPPAGSTEAASSPDIRLTVAVDRVYKGKVGAEQVVTAQGIAGYCGLSFAVSDTVLVFATNPYGGSTPEYVTSLCSGTEVTSTAPASFGDGKRPVGYVPASAVVPQQGSSSVLLLAAVALLAVAALAAGGGVWWRNRNRVPDV